MRFKYSDVVRDQFGNAVASASIYVYAAGTETDLTLYDANSAGNTLATSPQVIADANGYFQFWIDDTDYDHDQKIKLSIQKAGFTTIEQDYIDIMPITDEFIQSKDSAGEKWYMEPDASDGGLLASKTKGDIV